MIEKIVVVTGANGDIGKPLVEALLASNYKVAACIRDIGSSTLPVVPELKLFKCDFSLEESIKSCVDEIKTEYKAIYGIVNCVGVAHGAGFMMTKIDELQHIFNINYFSVISFTQQLVRRMLKARTGSIVNLASTAGILSDKGTLAYGASKAALIHSTKVMASELGGFGIRVNAVAPAVVESKMAEMMDSLSLEKLNDRAALDGKIYPAEIVDAILYLLSDSARSITGQVLKIDRGITN